MFKVIVKFVDLQDDNHIYRVGDVFPRPNKKVSEARISELKSADNKRHRPLIEEVKIEAPEPVKIEEIMPKPTEEEKNEETVEEVKPKRTSRKKK